MITTPAPTSVGKPPVVLLVDDLEDNREIYSKYLEFVGFRVEQAASGASAIERARAVAPDVIVMDIAMPGMDGCEATARIKKDPKTKHVGVIALTAYDDPEVRVRAKKSGAVFFVVKPCTPNELAIHVYECMRRSATKKK